jgi:predicted TIM-barrel fold metal-dependent hydrolase
MPERGARRFDMIRSMQLTRRSFALGSLAAAVARPAGETIIDIHQHTDYTGRPDEVLIAHQQTMGITKTVLLPAGRYFGLEAGASGNERCLALVKAYPDRFAFFANEIPYIDEFRPTVEKYLKLGAIGIGEQKFFVDCDSKVMDLIASVAAEFDVPVLLHFQHEKYNVNFDRFHKVLERHPKVNFIGHAQTWWGNIDKNHEQPVMYPKTKVTPGGITDRLLSDYPNMYGDLSAGSGNNALLRDEDHAREFLRRHQDKLLYGSDCNDHLGRGDKCIGARQIATIKRLATPEVQRKIFAENARRLMRLG